MNVNASNEIRVSIFFGSIRTHIKNDTKQGMNENVINSQLDGINIRSGMENKTIQTIVNQYAVNNDISLRFRYILL